MVVTGVNGGAFCQDFGSVLLQEVTGGITVNYTITHTEGAESLTETYTPDTAGRVSINDLGSLAFCYFHLPDMVVDASAGTCIDSQETVRIEAEIFDSDSGTRQGGFSQLFFYSNCRTNIPEAYKYNGFLSRHRRCKVRPSQAVNVGYYYRGQSFGLGIAYRQGGATQWKETTLTTPANAYKVIRNLNVSTVLETLVSLVPEVTADDILYYIAYLKYDNEVTDAIQFDVDRRYFPAETGFVYYNCFGIPESLHFTGQDERTAEMDATFARLDRKYRKIDTGFQIFHNINTGFINETLRDCVEDLVNSDKVCLYDASGIGEQVTVTELDFLESKPRTEPINVRLTYRLASECQRRCDRDPAIDYRIFDHTFGEAFE